MGLVAVFTPNHFIYVVGFGKGLLVCLTLLLCLPMIMLMARRLRDSNNSRELLVLILVPILGWLLLIFFFCKKSQPYALNTETDSNVATVSNAESASNTEFAPPNSDSGYISGGDSVSEVAFDHHSISASVSGNERVAAHNVPIIITIALLVVGSICNYLGMSLVDRAYDRELSAYAALQPSSFTRKAAIELRNPQATAEGRKVVELYFDALAKGGDYRTAYRQLAPREMERYGDFETWKHKVDKQHYAVENISLDFVYRSEDDEPIKEYMGYVVTFKGNRRSMAVNMYYTGTAWVIYSVKPAEKE
nr:DUF805 domain-containing protein [Veillonella denticariosi]